ncbi:restriction endonuclease subunit S [Nostoc sp.]|uniref:restriction endonuclease subunit S n=1 Tax=Nostoc sp. TaxID=1180 RepID=UPI003592E876
MNKWKLILFVELYLEPSKNGLNRPKRVRGKGYKMVNMGEIFTYDRIRNPFMELVPMNELEKEKYNLKTGDLLFARQSLVAAGAGKCSIVLETPEITTFESHLIRVRLNPTKATPLFYYYYFTSPMGKANVQSLVMQVAAAGIRGSELAQLPVPFPSLPTQKKIAGILSAYDDLIENNTRRIKILEEMAQTLYHEWFVKFRFPGHEHTKMLDSELGLIPEGCEVRKLGDVAKVISGFAFKSKDFQDEGIPVIKIKNIRNGTVDISDIQCVDSSFLSLNSKYHIKRGDLLISLTGSHLTQPNSVVGRVDVYSQSKKVCLLNQRAGKIFITNPERCKISYLFYLLSSEDRRRSIALMASGAASQANISPTQVESLDLLIPGTEILNLFHQIISPIFEQISNLEIKNFNLRQTRDLFLPKLISGEIDVEHLEITTEDIAT